jgi:2-polyprenyl-3-methyl-5-hydroxy-6-metoxy-1,4-benzoquinol methylase
MNLHQIWRTRVYRDTYDESYFQRFLVRKTPLSQRDALRLTHIRRYVSSGKLLEIGFGQGGLLRMAARYFDVAGVDISPYGVRAAYRWLGNRVRCGDIAQETLPTAEHQVVAAFGVLEHLQHPQVVLNKLYDTLVDGGVLVGAVPNNQGIVGSINTAITNLADATHCSTYSPQHWSQLFYEVGFRQIDFCGEITLTPNRAFFITSPLWKHISFNLIFACVK